MSIAIAFIVDVRARYDAASYNERLRRLAYNRIAADHEILAEIVAESFVGELMAAEGIQWEFSPIWGEIRLVDPTDAQLVAVRLALSDDEHMFVYEDNALRSLA